MWADLTETVRDYGIRIGKLVVSNGTFGVDPYEGIKKMLRVYLIHPDGTQEERIWFEVRRIGG